MNYLKIQQELLKNAIAEKGGWVFGKYENNMGISEGHVVWLIPENCFVLDVEQLEKRMVKCFDMVRALNYDCCKYEDAVNAPDMKQCNKKTLVKIKGKTKEAWVDVSLLKYFDSPTFKISSPNSALMVFEKEELVGMVLPYRLKGGDTFG